MKILFIVNTDGALYVFRKPIIEYLVSKGHEVISITSRSSYFDKLKAIGVSPYALDFSRHSAAPLKNLILMMKLRRLIRQLRPDIVHSFTHKPAIYGTFGARSVGVKKVFVTITGLGTLFVNEDFKTKLVRSLLLIQYKVSLQLAEAVFFQNPDDMEFFVSRKIVSDKKSYLTFGSGIDLEEFSMPDASECAKARSDLSQEIGLDTSSKNIVILPARAVREKGVADYYEAAKFIHRIVPNKYVFIHVGMVDKAVAANFAGGCLESYARENGVIYLGHKRDIKGCLLAADIVCLPSYREGTPRSLIEALALGKVLVTTDVPGCRETVVDGWNGLLCKVKSPRSLAEKILAVNKRLISDGASRSRALCEAKYDVDWLVRLTASKYFSKGIGAK